MGQFYASLESGHTTASTALKRLASYSGKNHFYRANRELGRIFKTEYILQYMSDPFMRQRIRRGLLKGEEIHALARQVAYGKQGKITARDFEAQKNTSSCLTVILACIIYWQAKEINRVILECDPESEVLIYLYSRTSVQLGGIISFCTESTISTRIWSGLSLLRPPIFLFHIYGRKLEVPLLRSIEMGRRK